MVEHPLERLQNSICRFIAPSAVMVDIQALSTQIELRRRALKDIEIIRCRLRLPQGCAITGLPRRKRGCLARRPHSAKVRRGR